MKLTVRAFVVLAGLVLAVGGCSSSSSGGTTAEAVGSTSVAATKTDGPDSAMNDQLAGRLCDALVRVTADMQMSDASPEAAMAQTAIALADVYGDDVASMDASQIETMTKKTCPDVHDEALKTMKVDSLDALR